MTDKTLRQVQAIAKRIHKPYVVDPAEIVSEAYLIDARRGGGDSASYLVQASLRAIYKATRRNKPETGVDLPEPTGLPNSMADFLVADFLLENAGLVAEYQAAKGMRKTRRKQKIEARISDFLALV